LIPGAGLCLVWRLVAVFRWPPPPKNRPTVLPSKYVASIDHTGLLRRRSARCSVITQRAGMQQRPSSATASVSACAASCFVAARVRASREEKTASPIPAESHVAACMHAGGEKRGHLAAPGRQTKLGGYREGPLASDIWYWFVQSRASHAGAWSEHNISLHKAASEVMRCAA
jgi:hypothetical protein